MSTTTIANLINTNETHRELLLSLLSVITSAPPPFVHIQDSTSPRLTNSVLRRVLSALQADPDAPFKYRCAMLDSVTCIHPRVLYDSVLNQLSGFSPIWENGCLNYQHTLSEDDQQSRYNDSLDAF